MTREELIRHTACARGLAYFDEIAPEGKLSLVWDVTTQVRFAVEAREWIGWAREKNLVPIVNLSGANLTRADLSGADLTEVIGMMAR